MDVVMVIPTFEKLADLTALNGPKIYFAGCSTVHPNPKLYKYYWWIFTQQSLTEGSEFLSDDNRLCISDFNKQLSYCRSNNVSAYIYNQRLYRFDKQLPWDYKKLKQQAGIQFAPSFDQDCDPLTLNGFK